MSEGSIYNIIDQPISNHSDPFESDMNVLQIELPPTFHSSSLELPVFRRAWTPEVTKCTGGCRLTASGLKNKGKPMCRWGRKRLARSRERVRFGAFWGTYEFYKAGDGRVI